MLNEVYLICSLPALSFGQTPPISLEEFREMAEHELSARSFKALEHASMRGTDSKGRNTKFKRVKVMLDGLQQDLIGIRKAKEQNEKPNPALLPESLLEANPLEREIQLIQWQWEYLDAIVTGNTFTLTEVIVYKLKLQLLFRMHSFSTERGERVLTSVINPTLKKEE